MAENVKTKVVTKSGFEKLVDMLDTGQVRGKGLSQENFTTELKTALENLRDAEASGADLTEVKADLLALKNLVEGDSDGAINKFNEIINFLAGIEDTKTLGGIVAGIGNDIATAKGEAISEAAESAAELYQPKGEYLTAEDIEPLTDEEIDAILAGE